MAQTPGETERGQGPEAGTQLSERVLWSRRHENSETQIGQNEVTRSGGERVVKWGAAPCVATSGEGYCEGAGRPCLSGLVQKHQWGQQTSTSMEQACLGNTLPREASLCARDEGSASGLGGAHG